ncbi:MAG TPA: hypothetical protein VMW75_21645 [Thermoanaerobaculia bacterium]|nr:hypothetical protein [Thermoanaerobaculia bacterium]
MTDGHHLHGEFHPGDHAHEHEPHPPAPGPHPADSEEFDAEINIRAILWTAVGVVATCVVSVVAMWGMFVGFDAFDRRHAAPPPPMAKAMGQPEAPEPRLQAAPTEDMIKMHEADELGLRHAAWIDQAQGTVRVPIDVAIDVLAARGLPKVTTPPLAEMAAHGSTAEEGRPPTDQPSPGTLLPPPGQGMGNIGPPSAGAGQLPAPAMPEPAAGQPAAKAPAVQPAPHLPNVPPPPPGGMP